MTFRSNIIKTTFILFIIGLTNFSCQPLLEDNTGTEVSSKKYSIEEAFTIVAKENDVARTLYTKAIVGAGKKKGLKFDEDWEKDHVEAGPLPALFLRGIAGEIRKDTEVPLGLFLGSDFPIRKSNKFKGKQAELFAQMREDEQPKFFFDEENKLYTAMFPDFASAGACVSCHNQHPETTKSDWVLGDIQGATTWTYPEDSVSFDELEKMIMAYRNGASSTFQKYIDKTKTFKDSDIPVVGVEWPAEGYQLPEPTIFLDSVGELASEETLNAILKL
ncbi:DUF3365 domain-containing protein [Flammeovirga yaeyamensis]|uniref:DUF3365 domain-containing protein n=1 Tax=Flammeovirga yaeyamensis TaxID=367791 RepID=A0AAX1N776_9BACT|nr:DUF3365 domain-containing protein [Flammeovirga yaeyamensis]MBB3697960.1 hypothetical protein [Flammeovirga yaeyamensis]NMF35687.1 DUF3365 domain-containing protein [Flammeovirga yaeyamensis]QWG03360.1 DUF3365 domain-containing protein [Flammeovirga yaeyamensis]